MPVLSGIVLQGASLLPTAELKAAFGRLYGRQLNVNDMHAALDRLNRWYEQRGVLGQVRKGDWGAAPALRVPNPKFYS